MATGRDKGREVETTTKVEALDPLMEKEIALHPSVGS